MRRTAFALVALASLAGCAPLASVPASAPVPVAGQSAPAPPPATTAPLTTPRASAAPDSTPSSDALRVLATIPEPVAPGDRETPGARDTLPRHMLAPPAAYDTLRLAPSSMTDSIPVPAPTRPMMEAPPITMAPVDTVPHAPTAAATVPPAKEGDCWRLQIAAPTERARAQEMQSAAESQLLSPMTMKLEGKRWKVRTRDCMDRESADRLRLRAIASGFAGVFLVHVAAAGR